MQDNEVYISQTKLTCTISASEMTCTISVSETTGVRYIGRDFSAITSDAKNALLRFTQSPASTQNISITTDALYDSAYVGYVSGMVQGLGGSSDYEIRIYSTTDIDYLQATLRVRADGTWDSGNPWNVNNEYVYAPLIQPYMTQGASCSVPDYVTLTADSEERGNFLYQGLAGFIHFESQHTNHGKYKVLSDGTRVEMWLPRDGAPNWTSYYSVYVTRTGSLPYPPLTIHAGFKTFKLYKVSTGELITQFYESTGIVRSYDVPQSDPSYQYLVDRCFTYDQAVAIVSACCMQDQSLAELLTNGYIKIMNANADTVSFSVNHKSGIAPDPYFRSGATAWGVIALGFFLQCYPTSSIAAIVETKLTTLANFLLTFQSSDGISDLRNGLIKGGQGKYSSDYLTYDPNYIIQWCSTEHNIDAWFGLYNAGILLGNTTFINASSTIQNAMVERLWSIQNGRFYQGISNSTTIDTAAALDCNSWGSLVLNAWGETAKRDFAIEKCNAYKITTNNITGYRPYTPEGGYPNAGTGIWAEGTFGVVLARFAAGQTQQALNDFVPLCYIVDDSGLPYSTIRDYIYELSDWYSVAAIAWLQIAIQPRGFWGVNQDNTGLL